MTILGVGMDIVETKRIAESVERFGDRFLNRVFLEGEIAYARSMKFPHLHLAAHFAAKEAISKAFGTGIGTEMGWKDLEVVREPNGAPRVCLHGRAEAFAKARGVQKVHISLSHTAEYGAASVVIEAGEGQTE
jgi:holo-[acyl-carrier protein] synthase